MTSALLDRSVAWVVHRQHSFGSSRTSWKLAPIAVLTSRCQKVLDRVGRADMRPMGNSSPYSRRHCQSSQDERSGRCQVETYLPIDYGRRFWCLFALVAPLHPDGRWVNDMSEADCPCFMRCLSFVQAHRLPACSWGRKKKKQATMVFEQYRARPGWDS